MLCTIGKVGKSRMALKDDEQLMAIQHIHMARTCLHCYKQIRQVHMYESYCLYLASTLEIKAEAAHHHHGIASYVCFYMV